jgi:NADH-quinone oxidoreductase subunit J
MVCLAAIYACLEVHVVALFQVLIYVGAVMVFMVYTIMLLDDRDASFREPFSRLRVPAVLVAVAVAAALLWMLGGALPDDPGTDPRPGVPAPFTFVAFSIAFLKQYWFHFELVTVLLLVGVVAAWTAIREAQA